MLYAMLSAYKRTLSATMARSQSLEAVVAAKPVPWITTPDLVMAWGVAFGLERELDAVLARSLTGPAADDPRDAAPRRSAWQPTWWLAPSGRKRALGRASGLLIRSRALLRIGHP